jgi:hypothetical protein
MFMNTFGRHVISILIEWFRVLLINKSYGVPTIEWAEVVSDPKNLPVQN